MDRSTRSEVEEYTILRREQREAGRRERITSYFCFLLYSWKLWLMNDLWCFYGGRERQFNVLACWIKVHFTLSHRIRLNSDRFSCVDKICRFIDFPPSHVGDSHLPPHLPLQRTSYACTPFCFCFSSRSTITVAIFPSFSHIVWRRPAAHVNDSCHKH